MRPTIRARGYDGHPLCSASTMVSRSSFGLAVAATSALLACKATVSPARAPAPELTLASPAWSTTLDHDMPLVGKMWDTSSRTFVEPRALAVAVAQADYVLLGEKHDNPDHHRLQAAVIRAMLSAGEKPALALEMLEPDQDAAVARYRAAPSATASGLGEAIGWDKSGWPPWPTYLPIAEVAFQAGLPLMSANLPRATVRSIAHGGVAALPPEIAARLGLDKPLAPALETSLEEEMRASHCGQLPETMVAPMALAQRARDGQMADRMISATTPVVLIAGAGHVRRDRGVPVYLSAAKPRARVVSVAFMEVEGALGTPDAYAKRFGTGALPFDYVWFTPRANDDDPCADFHIHRP
jgi:uncharacterized iron-regulated protein